MAKKTLPQNRQDCQASKQKINIFSGTSMKFVLAAEVLKLPSNTAAEMLKSAGFDFMFDYRQCPLNDLEHIAKFYNINDQYTGNVLRNYSITLRDMPEHVFKSESPYTQRAFYSPQVVLALPVLMYWGTHLNQESVGKKVCAIINASEVYKRAQKEFDLKNHPERATNDSETPTGNALIFRPNGDVVMSGEVFEKLLARGQSGGNTLDSIPAIVQKSIADVFERMKIVIAPEQEQGSPEPQAAKEGTKRRPPNPARPKPENWDELSKQYLDGKITCAQLSEGTGIRKSSLSYYLNKWNPGHTHPGTPVQFDDRGVRQYNGQIRKLTKPDNWDEVVELYHNKKISAVEGAKRTGMSHSSFCRYAGYQF